MKFSAGCASVVLCLLCASCAPPPGQRTQADPQIAREIDSIKAIDNHAHPVRLLNEGEHDADVDALPVEMMEVYEPLPVPLRPENFEPAKQAMRDKARMIREKGDSYPDWVLDQLGIDVMMANRVAMGRGLPSTRFKWIPFADPFMYPLNNDSLGARDPDRKAFFGAESKLLSRYLNEAGASSKPARLDDYRKLITSILERWKGKGAVGVKFEMAYLRTLRVDPASGQDAARVFSTGSGDYKMLQDHLFEYVAAECGRLRLPVQIHTGAGAGRYYDVSGANPANLASAVTLPSLRNTQFILVHGGWPYVAEAAALLAVPNVWIDYSLQSLYLTAPELSQNMRKALEYMPEKVVFGTDSGPYGDGISWEETGWLSAKTGRDALGLALTGMMRDGVITRDRAVELAHMVMRDNARRLYGLP
jgi:predicted TIM-barrel fold metal-dependent hydrolase